MGWNRAHKHEDSPDEELIKQRIEDSILEEINEWFEFESAWG